MEHLSGARPKKNNKRTDEAAANSIYAQVQFSDIILVKNIVLALLFDMDSRDTRTNNKRDQTKYSHLPSSCSCTGFTLLSPPPAVEGTLLFTRTITESRVSLCLSKL